MTFREFIEYSRKFGRKLKNFQVWHIAETCLAVERSKIVVSRRSHINSGKFKIYPQAKEPVSVENCRNRFTVEISKIDVSRSLRTFWKIHKETKEIPSVTHCRN